MISKATIYYVLPLFIIGALYILMAKRLHTSAREMPGEALGMQSRSQARARRYVARMVVAFVVSKLTQELNQIMCNPSTNAIIA